MVDPRTSRFWQAALQSRLIDVAELTACWETLPPEKRVADQLDRRLARQAMQAGLLTLWQAQQLLAGRSTGYKIDRYVLLEMIGQGGMGRVYLAKDSRLNRRVALKILSPERVNNPRAIARFQREARVGAQLQHENLVRIYDEGESDGKCYLVMEFIEGKTIGSMIAEHGPLPPSTAAKLTQQVAMGLEHAQQKGLIHRDVNPYNIMVTGDGTAKLADLGLAIDLAEQVQVTRDGATVGTFDYISPEQARHSHAVDTRSDIYSLGCTLYHMLAGQVPFPSPSLPEKLFGHQTIEPESLMALVPDLPEGLVEVVRTMMRKQPDDRFASPLEVARALDPFVGESASTYRADGLLLPGGAPPPNEPTHSSTQVTTGRRETLPAPDPRAPAPKTTHPDFDALVPDVPLTSDYVSQAKLLEGLVEFGAKSGPPVTPTPELPPAVTVVQDMDFTRIGQEKKPRARAMDDLSGLGLALDFGPEPTLSEVAANGKLRSLAAAPQPKPARKTKAGATPEAKAQGRGRDRRLVFGGAAVVVLIAVAGGLFATGVLGKPTPGLVPAHTPPRTPHPATAPAAITATPGGDDGPVVLKVNVAKGQGQGQGQRQGITVKAPDGTTSIEPDLKTAMKRAIGSRGHVLLNNREPLRLSGADAAIKVGGGPLYIRAAEGMQPVLEVALEGSKPFLTTGVETPLTIVGVTIVAHSAEPGRDAPPIIDAAGKVTLDRCAFKATGKAGGARAVKAQGIHLTVTGTWFEGFDEALDIVAFNGSAVTVRQSIFVRARAGAPPSGWALRVRSKPGGGVNLSRRLVLDRCTVLGKGLFDLAGFSPQMPYKVEVKGCAVFADALLAWQPQAPGLPPSDETLRWLGQDNLYDVRGKAWVVLSPQGSPELPDGPTDLDSWTKLVDESTPLPPPAKFQIEPANLPESPSPRDLLVIGTERPVGADPDRVGPRTKSSKP
jgi:serine/threonine protein kinase